MVGLLRFKDNDQAHNSICSGRLRLLLYFSFFLAFASCACAGERASQHSYRSIENWAKLPQSRVWGEVIGTEISPGGQSVWVLDRCGRRDAWNRRQRPSIQFRDLIFLAALLQVLEQ